jgi:DNA-binding NarL/FixJ family response regulator
MDVRMPGMNGLDAAQKVTTLLPQTRVLILTTFDVDDYAFGALRAGASGFLLKDTRPAELIAAVRAVHRGDAVMAPRITAKLIDLVAPQLASTRTDESATALSSLTPREREVFALIGQGATNGEIATELYLSESTVKTHVGRILLKQGLRDRVQAVILAYELGVVKP